tara:strand:+ start:289 stop:867 length:579 start_codon:yes stop_codon:yes gene_type:complete
MAISINGNGTITGISTGGLPDGCVDTDTLAAGAATQAKRTYASDEVIQTKYNSTTTAVNMTSNGSYQEIGFATSITPTSSSSDIMVLCDLPWDLYTASGGEAGIRFKLTRTVSGTETTLYEDASAASTYNYSSSGATQVRASRIINFKDTSISTTSAATYKVYCLPVNTSSNSTKVATNSTLASMILIEVAA